MNTNIPSLSDQIAAAFSAIIPFSFALLAVSIVVWRLFKWRYEAVIEKTKALYELSKLEVQHLQQAATNKEATLSATVSGLQRQVED